MNQTEKKGRRGLWSWIPGLLISLGAILVLIFKTDLPELLDSFSRIQLLPYLGAIVLFLVSLIIRSLAWQLFMRKEVSFRDTFFVENEGYLINNLLPFRLGELGRALIMGRVSEKGPANILSTIILERICDVGIAAIFISITLPRALDQNSLPLISWILIGLLSIGITLLLIIVFNYQKIQKKFEDHKSKSKFIEKRFKGGIKNFLQGLIVLRDPKYFVAGLVLLAFSWGIAIIEYFLIMQSFIPDAPVWWTFLGLGALALGVAIPSAPANAGVFEVALVAALALVGVSNNTAMAYALVVHIMHFVINCILGLIGLRIHGSSLSGLWNDLRRPSTAEAIREK